MRILLHLSFDDVTSLCTALQDVLGVGEPLQLTEKGKRFDSALLARLERVWVAADDEFGIHAANDAQRFPCRV